MSAGQFSGKTALITGASRGIGEAFAVELAQSGARVVLVARSREPLERLAERLRNEHRATADVLPLDLTRSDSAEQIARHLDDEELEVDLLINNAGLGAVGPFLDGPLGPSITSVEVNVSALLRLTHEVGGRMLRRRRGAIINVGSVAGFLPLPYEATYAASKAFVLSFSDALAEELRETPIRVMAAHPGPVSTGFFEGTTVEPRANAVDAKTVVKRILRDLERGRQNSYPGRSTDLTTVILPRLLPRKVILKLAARHNREAGFHTAVDHR